MCFKAYGKHYSPYGSIVHAKPGLQKLVCCFTTHLVRYITLYQNGLRTLFYLLGFSYVLPPHWFLKGCLLVMIEIRAWKHCCMRTGKHSRVFDQYFTFLLQLACYCQKTNGKTKTKNNKPPKQKNEWTPMLLEAKFS